MSENTSISSSRTLSYTTHSSFLREVSAGSEAAWFEFYRKYAAMIRYIGEKRQLTPEECDDLMVDVMMIFWKRLDNFIYEPEKGRFRNYLGRITDSVVSRILRKKRNANLMIQTAELDYPDEIDQTYMNEWRNFILEKALEELKNSVETEQYQIFYMSFFQKRTVADIAEVSGKSAANIYTIKSRCLKKLKELIATYRQKEEMVLASHSQRNMQEN